MKSRDALIRLKRFEVEEKRRKVADIEAMISDFNHMAVDLDRQNGHTGGGKWEGDGARARANLQQHVLRLDVDRVHDLLRPSRRQKVLAETFPGPVTGGAAWRGARHVGSLACDESCVGLV